MFKKAKQSRVFQDVVDQIQDAILEGRLPPGSKLPAERDLKDMFNTSRGTLREALRVLEQKGLIEIKLGVSGGAIVKKITTEPIIESLALLIQSRNIPLEDLYEFRIKLEGSLAELAALRVTEEDIEQMTVLVEEAEDCIRESDWDGFLKIDEAIHTLMGKMSRNAIFQFVQKSIHDNIHRYYNEYLPLDKDTCLENFHDLEQLLEALKQKDSQKTSELIMDHMHRFNIKMKQK
jgi:DNA-binding FadR family transcriptional regulator